MKLYLVRHAVAYDHGDPAYPNDDDRPLTPKGRKRFVRAVEGLFTLIDPPAVALSSPLPRAWQTAEILAEAAGPGVLPLVTCAALRPGGGFEQILRDCRAQVEAANDDGGDGGEAADAENAVRRRGLALVGHAPSLGLLAAWLLNGDGATFALDFEKGGAACIAFDDLPVAGGGDLAWLVTPRILRRLRA